MRLPNYPTTKEIRSKRLSLEVRQEECAEAIGMTLAGYSEIERRGDMRISQANKIIDFLNKREEELM